MWKGQTESGFAFEIDEAVGDDWEILELLDGIAGNDIRAMIKFGNALLGKDQLGSLKEHLRQENGRVKTSDMSNELMEILSSIKDAKN